MTMDEIATEIKKRKVSRNVSLMALTALEEQDEIVLFTKNDLLSLLEAVARDQRETDSQVTSICTEFIAENDLVTNTLKELL